MNRIVMALKTYTLMSARRASTDIKDSAEAGNMTRTPHYNSILAAFEKTGAAPFIPFKINSQEDGSPAWRKMRAIFLFKQDEFLAAYGKRSNVEATFSAVKRKFGQSVRSKTFTAQVNEILCKVLCYNLSILVHAMHKLGIEPSFLGKVAA